jgi:hypothetical protein
LPTDFFQASLYFSLIPLHDADGKLAAYVEKCRNLVFSGEVECE